MAISILTKYLNGDVGMENYMFTIMVQKLKFEVKYQRDRGNQTKSNRATQLLCQLQNQQRGLRFIVQDYLLIIKTK